MPYVEIAVYGRTVTAEEKERLFTGCVDVLGQALQSRPQQVRVALHAWPEGSFYDGAAGAKAKGETPAEGGGR